MKKRKSGILIAGILLVVCGTSAAVFAMSKSSVVNHISTGIVDVEIQEYQVKDGEEIKWQDNPQILPGADISKIPRICNHGNDCYVRVKLAFSNTYTELEDDIYGISDKWVKKEDGYYYYEDVLKQGEAVDIFRGILIPADFPQAAEESVFCLDIEADAIQSQNFTPDFSDALPWGQIEILTCEKNGPYSITTVKAKEEAFFIEYLDGSEELFINADDFFADFPVLMPGDVYQDSVQIKNSSGQDTKLYFRSEMPEAHMLLEEVNLVIAFEAEGESRMLYRGPLKAESLSEDRLLAELPKDSQGELIYTITVPAELNNTYSAETSQVKWTFSAASDKGETVRTGDNRRMWIFIAAAAVSLITAVILVRRRQA